MAVTYTESAETDFGTGSASYTKPGGTTTGDYLIIFHDRRSDNATHDPTPPSGWSTAYQVEITGQNAWAVGYYRKVDGTEGAGPYVVGGTTAYGQFGSIGVIAGADGTTLLFDSQSAMGTGTSASTGATIDGDTGGVVLFHVITDGAATTGNPTAQFGGTVAQQFTLDGGDSELWSEHFTTGNTARTYSISWSGSKYWAYGCVSLRAAAGAPAVIPVTPVILLQAVRRAAFI